MRRQAFADDLLLWIVGDFLDGVVHPDLMRAMSMVERWSLEWRVHFSVMKCESMLFRKKNVRVTQQFEVSLYGECLPHVSELRYLGVWFDAHLTWGRQI